MFYHTSSHEVLQMENNTYESQESLSHDDFNYNIVCMGDTTLAAVEEADIDGNWCLLDNQSTCNSFVSGNYLPNIREDPNGKYLRVHCNIGVKYANKIGDIPG